MKTALKIGAVAALAVSLTAAAHDVTVGRDGTLTLDVAGGLSAKALVNYRDWHASISPRLSMRGPSRYVLCDAGETFGEGEWSLAQQADGSVLVTNRFVLSADVTAQACGTRIYLPYANWTGCVWRVDGGAPHAFPCNRTRSSLFGGKSVRSVALTRGGETVTFAFPNPRVVSLSNDAAWCDAFSLRLQQAGDYKKGTPVETVFAVSVKRALTGGIAEPNVARRGADWIPMTMKKGVVPGGATDFSAWRLAQGPAGKDGWLKRVGDHFEFEKKPGEAVRFYGVNLVSSCCWPQRKEDADDMAARLVRSGYNTVRLHHFECAGGIATTRDDPSSTTLDATRLDQMDYLVSRLIAAGLYVTIDLYSYRTATWRSLGIDRDGSPTFQQMKPLIHLTDAGYENWRRYAENLMTHVNPYTGRAYKDEPGMPLISLVNEARLNMAWNLVREMDCVKKLFSRDVSTLPPSRIPEFSRVAAEVEENSARRMVTFLRGLGAKALITDLNNGPFEPEFAGLRERWFDFDDNHFYVDHPNWLGVRLRLPYKNKNRNYFDYGGQSPLDIALKRQPEGRPYTITEWNFSGPAAYRHQGGLLTGAVAAQHGWDGLWAFTWSHSLVNLFDGRSKSGIGNFDILLDPIQQANERAMVALYLRGDARAAAGKPALATNACEKCLTVDTPRTQGGAALAGRRFATADMSVCLAGADAAVWATSVDGKPLAESSRILVTHATDVQNEGMEWADAQRTIVIKRGGLPLVVRNGRAAVALRLAPGSWRCHALATDGTRLGTVPCAFRDGELAFEANVARDPANATMLYELERTQADAER